MTTEFCLHDDPFGLVIESMVTAAENAPGAKKSSSQLRREFQELLGSKLQAYRKLADQGIRILRESEVSVAVSQALLRIAENIKLENWEGVTRSCTNETFERCQAIAREFLAKEEIDKAEAVYTFLSGLRPLDERTMVGLLTVMWHREGATAAAKGYDLFIENLPTSPMLLYFATDCLLAANRPADARDYINEAVDLLDQVRQDTDDDRELAEMIRAFAREDF